MTELVIGVLGSSVIAGFIGAWFGRRKTDAEAAKLKAEADVTQGEGWQALLAAQQRQMDRMAAELESLRLGKIACEAELGELRRRLAALERATGANRASTPKLDVPRKPKPVNGSAT